MPLLIEIIPVLNVILWTSAGVSFTSNILMVYIICFKSPHNIGAYKRLTMVIAIFEILCSVIHVLLAPVHFSHGSAIVVISTANVKLLGRPLLSALHTVFWALIGASLALFAVNFIYRYLAISQHSLLSTFNSWKLIFWLLVPLVNGVIWSFAGELLCGPGKEIADYVRKEVFVELGENIDKLVYRGSYLYETKENGKTSFRVQPLFTLLIFTGTVICSFYFIVYFGVKCYCQIRNVLKVSTSSHHQVLQKQLFYALVLQTLIPTLLMHIPVGIMFGFAFLNIEMGSYSAFVTVSVTIYPAIDPCPNFIIIKPYRDALIDLMRCRATKQLHPGHISSI